MNIEIVEQGEEDSSFSLTIQCPLCSVAETQTASNGFEFDQKFEHFYHLAGTNVVEPITEYEMSGSLVCRECGNVFFHSRRGLDADIVQLQKGNLWNNVSS